MDINNVIKVLEQAQKLGAKTVSFYRVQRECKDNPNSLDFILDYDSINVNDLLVYGDKPDQIHLELAIKGIN
jgi:hypothetical protein